MTTNPLTRASEWLAATERAAIAGMIPVVEFLLGMIGEAADNE